MYVTGCGPSSSTYEIILCRGKWENDFSDKINSGYFTFFLNFCLRSVLLWEKACTKLTTFKAGMIFHKGWAFKLFCLFACLLHQYHQLTNYIWKHIYNNYMFPTFFHVYIIHLTHKLAQFPCDFMTSRQDAQDVEGDGLLL